jgi:uncharacterized delta-60 repeat protein
MKPITKIYALTSFICIFLAATWATAADCYLLAPGCLDASFGAGTGKVTVNTDGNIPSSVDLDEARGLAVQVDGKIVAAGITHMPGNYTINKFVVVRVNTDGSLDTTFGGVGFVTTSFSTGNAEAHAVALQSDGQIVVVGTSVGSHNVFAVARYNQIDGSLDATFGSGGKTTVSFGSSRQISDQEARSVAIQADGKILVGGFAGGIGALARLNSNGSLDSTFGSGGEVTNSMNAIRSVVIQGDGKIVVGGAASVHRSVDFAVMRYNANGAVDTTFASGGIATTDFGSYAQILALRIVGNNNIVAAGNAGVGAAANFALARYTPSGQLDSTFGSGGKVTTDVFGNWDNCYALAIQADGKLVTAGFSYDASGVQSYFALIRYNGNGTLDNTFGSGGIVTTNIAGGPDNFAYGLAIQADGKIVAGGTTDTTNSSDGMYFALARYFP